MVVCVWARLDVVGWVWVGGWVSGGGVCVGGRMGLWAGGLWVGGRGGGKRHQTVALKNWKPKEGIEGILKEEPSARSAPRGRGVPPAAPLGQQLTTPYQKTES